MSSESPIFFDPTRRRATWLIRASLAGGVCLLALITIFWASVLMVPIAHRVGLRKPGFLPDNPARVGNMNRGPAVAARPALPKARPPFAHQSWPGKASGLVGGFYVDWDPASLESLRLHASELTHVFPGWLHLDETGGTLIVRDHDPSDFAARKLFHDQHLAVLPLLNNYTDGLKDFDEARLHALLISPAKRHALTLATLEYVSQNGYTGLMLDLETERDDDRVTLAGFVQQLAEAFHARGLDIATCTQVDDPKLIGELAAPCDFIVPMLYDLHWATGTPGPIAPQQWVEEELSRLLTVVPKEKIALALGNYAYDWKVGKPGAKTLTFGEAMLTAQESKDDNTDGDSDGVVQWDAPSQNPMFTYEEDNARHQVWLMDAATAWNVEHFAQSKGVSGRTLWYVGSEDPTLWSFFGKTGSLTDPQKLTHVRYGFEIDFEGEGELLDVVALPQPGERVISAGEDRRISGESWRRYPTACVLRRSGKQDKTIALTFDDGPDPTWTPQVLDALKAAGVPATFFVTGVGVEQNTGLARRIWNEGHELGNHSFYHPNLAEVGPARAKIELDATQRAIQSAIGRSTTLFRPPYGVDAQPETISEAEPIELAQRLGYLTVAEGLDPRDWEAGARRPTAQQLTQRIVQDAEAGLGSIVLLHDSGGDRSETVKAIPLLVAQLKAKGYKFVTVSMLAGAKSRDAFFPPVTGKQRLLALTDGIAFALTAGTGRILAGIFLLSLVAGVLRTAVTGVLALLQSQQPSPPPTTSQPSVSVVIAAYNEEKVIVRTIQALLASSYPNLEVLVVDDGSKDDTAGIVRRTFADEPRVRLLQQENGGKAQALNHGIAQSHGEILIGLDADTLFIPETVALLVRHFADPQVGAVAGNIQVGNRNNLWTRLQALEYTTSQNFDRRAFAWLNAIGVVPGCVGAWRRSAIEAAGGYTRDTLAEDADLTWRVRKAGWKLVTENAALAFTEAPERRSELMKQRYRWTFGTLQVMWKHRDTLFNRRYGWFGLLVVPSLWLFSMILPALAPAADVGILIAAFSGHLLAILGYFVAFLLLEALAALLAFSLEGADRSRRRDLWLLPVQRVVWRYLLLEVLWKALFSALKGARAGWGKLERRGTATAP